MYPKFPQLYYSISSMQQAKHHVGGHMNFAAAKGIEEEYDRVTGGNAYVDSKTEVPDQLRDWDHEKEVAEKAKEARLKREKKEKNLL
jgi:hypothetical protein